MAKQTEDDSKAEIQKRLDSALKRSFTMKPEPHAKPKKKLATRKGGTRKRR